MRKVLSFVLVFSLVLGSLGVSFTAAGASTPSDVVGTEFETEVKVLMALDVVTGYPDGSYKPEGAVTRAEIAALMVRVLGLDDAAEFFGVSSFSDMSGHWADKYVAVIAGKDIVNGYPDGTFKPDAKVSFPEALTMISRALGYKDGCEDLIGDWPVNYLSLAEDLNVTDDVNVVFSGSADRGAVATMLFNSLSVANVSVDNDGNVSKKTLNRQSNDDEDAEYVTFLTKLDCYFVEDDFIDAEDAEDALIDVSNYVFAKADVYRLDKNNDNELNDDDPIIAIDQVTSDTVTGLYDHVNDTYGIKFTDANNEEYDVTAAEPDTKVYVNGGETTFSDAQLILLGFYMTVYGELDEKDDNKFATIDGIVAWAATGEYLAEEEELEEIEEALEDGTGEIFGVELPTVGNKGEELDFTNITVDGAAGKLEDIQEGDVVTVFASAGKKNDDGEYDKVLLVVTRETKEIKVKKIDESNDESKGEVIDMEGNAYKITYEEAKGKILGGKLEVCEEKTSIEDFKVGNTYKIIFDTFGYVYSSEEIESTPDLYGIVIAASNGGSTRNPEIKLFTSDGETTTFDVNIDEDDTEDALLKDGVWGSYITTNFTPDGSGGYSTPSQIIAVSYELNPSGKIDKLTALITDNTQKADDKSYSGKSEKWNGNGFKSSGVIFYIADDPAVASTGSITGLVNDGDWDVLDKLEDDDEYTALYALDDGDIEVMVILDGTSNDEYFAVTGVSDIDDDKAEVEGFIDGKAVTKISEAKNSEALNDKSEDNFVYVVSYSAGEINKATMVRTGTALEDIVEYGYEHGIVTDTENNGFDVTADAVETYVELADDVVVYEIKFIDKEPVDIEVGDTNDIDKDDFIICIYNKGEEAEMVVVVDEDDIEDYEKYLINKGL